ncbi:MotA/TolQ/ExbB proton channel [Chloroherpeton thalassium ATCC 35110]|uniref:MotA/TolQ/ExbB proton channel n=1 Tax=Chloroherpeton thalassium (strain ATCC 35110 / GB-78) TaxID=517418 RepID=B3QWM2_CHLT3|nr:MotA/TolQ/ExbB proton channel family protein [Chloroherpeton thalassium]ACF14782.1 MotA/TolQ/ExbB proton channel [Chloroherpeton thalassium ATCC 35110]
MKQSLFNLILMVVAYCVALGFYMWCGQQPRASVFHALYDGGPIITILITLILMVISYVIERSIALKKAEGKGGLTGFIKEIETEIEAGKIDSAIEMCENHQSSLSAVIRAGLQKYKSLVKRNINDPEKRMSEMQKSIEEASMMEMPLLERNLVAISTIASIATMFGLFGTTIGMIRAFQALATGGAPDAVQLSLGISEALYNTALGIFGGISGIVSYNFFTNKIDRFTYMIDEAAYYIVQTLAIKDEKAA